MASQSHGIRTSPQSSEPGVLLGNGRQAYRIGQATQDVGFGLDLGTTHADEVPDNVQGRTRDLNAGGSTFRSRLCDA